MNLCRSIALGLLVCLFSAASAAAQDRPATLSTLFEDILWRARPGLEQRRRAARRHEPRGALQQRVSVGVQADERRADEPARYCPTAVTGIRLHLPIRFCNGHIRADDAKLRPDPRRARRNHRQEQDCLRLHVSVLLLRPPRRYPPDECPGGIHARQPPARRRSSRCRGDREHHRSDGEPAVPAR